MKNRYLSYQALHADLAILLLRLVFGGLFVSYGYQKLVGFDQIQPMFMDFIGLGSKMSLVLVIFAELICGFLVLIGLFTRLATIPIFITMVVAYFIAHGNDPFQVKALAFIFMILSIVVFFLGSGKYSVDKIISKP